MTHTVKKYMQMVQVAVSVTTVYGTLWGGGVFEKRTLCTLSSMLTILNESS